MTLSTNDLAEVRDWITWTPPTDDDLNAAHDTLGFKWAVVVRYLRRRLQSFIGNPAQFSVSGDYSQNTQANITALQAQLTQAEANLAVEQATFNGGVYAYTRRDPVRDCYPPWAADRAADAAP